MKKFSFPMRVFLVVLLSIAIILSTSMVFIDQMNRMIRDNTLNTINELAEHDLNTMHNHITRNWKELSNTAFRLQDNDTLSQLRKMLRLEGQSDEFQELYLVDENGALYSERNRIYHGKSSSLTNYLPDQPEPFVTRSRANITREALDEMLLYAVPLENMTIEGNRFVWLVGLNPLSRMQETMIINSFEKGGKYRGYSSIFDQNGNFIVNVHETSSIGQRENMFDSLQTGEFDEGWDLERIQNLIEKRTHFDFSFRSAQGDDELFCCVPVADTDWFFVSMVEQVVFTEITDAFVFSSASMVIIAVLVCACLLLLILYLHKEASTASAQAKARSEFLSNMSHEIRTPLNGILGLLYLIDKNASTADPDQLQTWTSKASQTARYLLNLVNDILDMSRMQAGFTDLKQEPFHLQEVLENTLEIERVAAKEELCLHQDLQIEWPSLIGDGKKIQQVLTNIVHNAVKFTPPGNPICLMARQTRETNGHITTTIICQDTGVGMSQEFLSHIWDSFTQEHNQNSDGTKGTGLGMAITRQIVEDMGGTIEVDSILGQGSTFTVTLHHQPAPALQDVPDSSTLSTSQRSSLPEMQQALFLIIAEDNDLNAEILEEILKEEGIRSCRARNGKEVLELLEQSQPGQIDGVLMDLRMPVLDGCEAARQIRTLNREDLCNVPIFACSANSFSEDLQQAEDAGMNGFLPKPIDVDELLHQLAESESSVHALTRQKARETVRHRKLQRNHPDSGTRSVLIMDKASDACMESEQSPQSPAEKSPELPDDESVFPDDPILPDDDSEIQTA